MEAEGKKTVLLFLLNEYADWEAAYLSTAINELAEEVLEVKTVSLTKAPVRSAGGLLVIPDHDLDSIPKDYASLILIGGYLWRSSDLGALEPIVQHCVKENRLLGAICDATVYLGSIGALNHVRHTSNDLEGLKDYAKDAYMGAEHYIPRNVIHDKNIITANGTAPIDFAREVLRVLRAAPIGQIESWYLFHRLGCYAM